MICTCKVLEDNSDKDFYSFKLKPLYGNKELRSPEPFEITHAKNIGGIYSGMPQLYETAEYVPLPIGTPWPVSYEDKINV